MGIAMEQSILCRRCAQKTRLNHRRVLNFQVGPKVIWDAAMSLLIDAYKTLPPISPEEILRSTRRPHRPRCHSQCPSGLHQVLRPAAQPSPIIPPVLGRNHLKSFGQHFSFGQSFASCVAAWTSSCVRFVFTISLRQFAHYR